MSERELITCTCGLTGTPERIQDYSCESNHTQRIQHAIEGQTTGQWIVSNRLCTLSQWR